MESPSPAAPGTPASSEPPAGLITAAERPLRTATGRWDGWLPALVVLAIYVVGFLLLSALRVHEIGKPMTFDAGNYEYYSGYADLHGWASPIALPGQLETYLDAQLNVFYYLLISHSSAATTVYTIASLQSLACSAIAFFGFLVGRRISGSLPLSFFAGGVAGTSAFVAPLHIAELGETSSDVLLSVLIFCGAALLYRIIGLERAGAGAYVSAAVAGVLLGAAAEFKFTEGAFSVSVVLAFAVALLVARRRSGWRVRQLLLLLLAVVAPMLVVAAALYAPEAVFLSHRYGDPFFPLLNGIFKAPYLQAGNYNPGYAANTLASLWDHFIRLVAGGDIGHNLNGLYLEQVRSPALFFALVIVAVALVVDLFRRDKPEALFLEVAFLAGYLIWALLFGFYRYLAPAEMAAGGIVIILVFLHGLHRAVTLVVVAALLAIAVPFSIYAVVGGREGFGSSYFGISKAEFANLQGDGVIMAGDTPMAYVVPDLPQDIELVRTGINLTHVMNAAWWVHVTDVLRANPRRHWIMLYGGQTQHLSAYLRLIGFPGGYSDCRVVPTAEHVLENLKECQVTSPAAA